MGQLKSIYGIARAVLPVLYCGYMLYYFIDVGGSVQGIKDIGLGPTVIGLGVVGLLFCLPLIWKILRMFRGAPKSGGPAPNGDDDDDDGGAAADAVIARYMARKAIEDALPSATPVPQASVPRPAASGAGPVKRPSFGRKPH